MWEARTEGGRLFATSFNLNMEDPATLALFDGIVEYVQSEAFQPSATMSIESVLRPLLEGIPFKALRGNDGNWYGGMTVF